MHNLNQSTRQLYTANNRRIMRYEPRRETEEVAPKYVATSCLV